MAKEGLGLEITELRLGLPDAEHQVSVVNKKNEKKRAFSEIDDGVGDENSSSGGGDRKMETNKSQVVGWPPVCSYRKKNSMNEGASKMYVKVSMDGAPFLRKIDLGLHKGYSDLALALDKLFGSYGMGEFRFTLIFLCLYTPSLNISFLILGNFAC